MRKRIISLLVAVCLLGLQAVQAFGLRGVENAWQFDLQTFGVLGEVSEESLTQPIARAEFITMLAKLLTVDTWDYTARASFIDVKQTDRFYKDLSNFVALGFVNGDGNTQFRPDDTITRSEAAKLLVTALGYTFFAERSGGYPVGYMVQASSLSLFKGVPATGDELTLEAAAKMMYNALDVEMLLQDGYENDAYTFRQSPDGTLRSLHENENDESLIRNTGVVTANVESTLFRTYDGLETGQVVIDGKIYDAAGTDAFYYLGQEVDFYVRKGHENTIVAIAPTKNNEVHEIVDRDIVYAGSDRVEYTDAEDNQQNLYLDSSAVLVRNLAPVVVKDADAFVLEQGFMRTVDNNGDGMVDVVFIEDFDSYRVDKVNDKTIFFADGKLLSGRPIITIEEEGDIRYILLDAQGKEIPVENVKANDVVSIVARPDGEAYKVYVGSQSAQGTFNSRYDASHEMTLDETTYRVEHKLLLDAKVGDVLTVYLNYRGEIAAFEVDESNTNYAYVIQYAAAQGLGADQVKLLIAGQFKDDEEIDESNENNTTSIPKLKGYNSAVEEYDLDSTVLVNGKRMDSASLQSYFAANTLNRVVKFTKNRDNVITKLEHPVKVGTSTKQVYNAYERCFGTFSGAFGTDNETAVICVPSNTVSGDRDYYATVDINNSEQYDIMGFDIQDNYHARLVVITVKMQYDSIVEVNDYSKFSVVQRLEQRADENGDIINMLTFMTEGKLVTYPIAEFAEIEGADGRTDYQPDSLKSGDVFYYTLTAGDEVSKIKLIQSFAPMPGDFDVTVNGSRIVCGKVDNVEYNKLIDVDNRYVDQVYINVGGAQTSIRVFVRNAPPVYIYSRHNNEIKKGSSADIMSDLSKTRIFAHVSNDKVKGVLLLRD